MTTRLRKKGIDLLPFNRGSGTGAGNPAVAGKHRTHYFWEEVWQRDSLLDILARFLHLEVNERTIPGGKVTRSATLIFPRYHQLACVRELVAASRELGAGVS